MLERPDIADDLIIGCINSAFQIDAVALLFLPLGADAETAVFRADTHDGVSYFVKLRRGPLFKPAVTIPYLLSTVIGTHTIPPISTSSGELWTVLDGYTVYVSPFVEGVSGFEARLTTGQWRDLGSTLAVLHNLDLPDEMRSELSTESFSSVWRDEVRTFLNTAETGNADNAEAAALLAMIRKYRQHIEHAVQRAATIAQTYADQALDLVPCHGDIHAGNVIITADGRLLVTDWDTLSLAPKERDLMFIGAGIGNGWNTPEESRQFYLGYGDVAVNADLIAYYRWERIVQDVVEFCRQLLLTGDGGEDRKQSLKYFESQFHPDSVVDMAYLADRFANV